MSKNWKRTERAVAARLGGHRVPVSGRPRGDAPDIEHPLIAVECKHRKRLPAWLTDALRQADAAARGDQLPVVILHEHGRRHEANLCLISMKTLVTLLARAGEPGGERAEEELPLGGNHSL